MLFERWYFTTIRTWVEFSHANNSFSLSPLVGYMPPYIHGADTYYLLRPYFIPLTRTCKPASRLTSKARSGHAFTTRRSPYQSACAQRTALMITHWLRNMLSAIYFVSDISISLLIDALILLHFRTRRCHIWFEPLIMHCFYTIRISLLGPRAFAGRRALFHIWYTFHFAYASTFFRYHWYD
jgi:hypothetical protein